MGQRRTKKGQRYKKKVASFHIFNLTKNTITGYSPICQSFEIAL
jgi:hypothetical protein